MMKILAAPLIGIVMAATPATAQSGPPLAAKNLQWANVGQKVSISAAAAPQGIKVGDKFLLVDADNKSITGTGTVVGTFRDGSNTGPITAWSINVDAIKR